MALPAGKAHPKTHHAQAVNLDTGEHVDAHGVTHKTSKANPAIVGGHTMVFAHGHPPMPFFQHAMHKTAVHKRMTRHQTHPHPRDVQAKMLPLLKKAGGMMPMGGGMGMAMAQPLSGGGPALPAGAPQAA